MMGAITKKTLNIIYIVMNISSVIFIISSVLMVFLVAIFFYLKKLDIVDKIPTTLVYVVCFLVVLVMLILDGTMAVWSGILVVKTIKNTSRAVMAASQKSKQNQKHGSQATSRTSIDQKFEQKIQSPFKITFGLIMALVLCVVIQLLAAAVASGAAEIDFVKCIWYFLNCLAVLVFAVIILFLFYPVFVDTDLAFKEIELSKALSNKKEFPELHTSSSSLSSMTSSPSIQENHLNVVNNPSSTSFTPVNEGQLNLQGICDTLQPVEEYSTVTPETSGSDEELKHI